MIKFVNKYVYYTKFSIWLLKINKINSMKANLQKNIAGAVLGLTE